MWKILVRCFYFFLDVNAQLFFRILNFLSLKIVWPCNYWIIVIWSSLYLQWNRYWKIECTYIPLCTLTIDVNAILHDFGPNKHTFVFNMSVIQIIQKFGSPLFGFLILPSNLFWLKVKFVWTWVLNWRKFFPFLLFVQNQVSNGVESWMLFSLFYYGCVATGHRKAFDSTHTPPTTTTPPTTANTRVFNC